MSRKAVGTRLKSIRADIGLNQAEFGDKVGCRRQAVLNYESGNRDIPQGIFEKIAELGYSVEWLLTGNGVMKASEIVFVPDDDQVDAPWEDDGIEIKDPGLDDLLSPVNRGKFLITEKEAEDLRNLAFRRKSKTTLQQWVSLLYMLREMDED